MWSSEYANQNFVYNTLLSGRLIPTFDFSATFASFAAIGIASIYCSELDSVALRRRDVPIAAADDFVCDFQSLRPAQPDYRYRT